MNEDKFNTIYADPPWKTKAGRPLSGYKKQEGKQLFLATSNKSRDLPYNSLTVEQICDFVPPSADDAHLYLWVTNQYLLRANEVIKAWGFKYSTTLVWAKKVMGGGLGGTFGINTEFLIFATKGSLKSKKRNAGTWFDVKREYVNGYPCHSKKPVFFHELIQATSPGPYLEMFARQSREGWAVFGNEVSDSITIHESVEPLPHLT